MFLPKSTSTKSMISVVWNIFLWMGLMLGWGLLIITYSLEFFARNNCAPAVVSLPISGDYWTFCLICFLKSIFDVSIAGSLVLAVFRSEVLDVRRSVISLTDELKLDWEKISAGMNVSQKKQKSYVWTSAFWRSLHSSVGKNFSSFHCFHRHWNIHASLISFHLICWLLPCTVDFVLSVSHVEKGFQSALIGINEVLYSGAISWDDSNCSVLVYNFVPFSHSH